MTPERRTNPAYAGRHMSHKYDQLAEAMLILVRAFEPTPRHRAEDVAA